MSHSFKAVFSYLLRVRLQDNNKLSSIIKSQDWIILLLGFMIVLSRFQGSEAIDVSDFMSLFIVLFFYALFNFSHFVIFHKQDESISQTLVAVPVKPNTIRLATYLVANIYTLKVSLMYAVGPYIFFTVTYGFMSGFLLLISVISLSVVSIALGLMLKYMLYKMSYLWYSIRYVVSIFVSLLLVLSRLLIELNLDLSYIPPFTYGRMLFDYVTSSTSNLFPFILLITLIAFLLSMLLSFFATDSYNQFEKPSSKIYYKENKHQLTYVYSLNSLAKAMSKTDDFQKRIKYKNIYLILYLLFYSFIVFEVSDFGGSIFEAFRYASVLFIMLLSINAIVLLYAEDTGAIDYFETIPGYAHKFLLYAAVKRIFYRGLVFICLLTLIANFKDYLGYILYAVMLFSLLSFSNFIATQFLKDKKLFNYKSQSASQASRDSTIMVMIIFGIVLSSSLMVLNWAYMFMLVVSILLLPFNVVFLYRLFHNAYIDLYKHHKQLKNHDCGLAVIQILLDRVGSNTIDKETYQSLMNMYKEGVNMQDLIDIAYTNQLNLEGYYIDFDEDSLKNLKYPLVCHLDVGKGHYIVLHEVNRHHLIIGDPSKRYTSSISKRLFFKQASGNILIIKEATHA